MMTLQQLTYFVASMRCGSLSAAADSLQIAQPSLSEQIQRLKRELGVPLFIRTNRGLVPTEAGELLLPRAQATLAAAEEARDAVRGVGAIEGGTVSFGTFSSAGHLILEQLIAAFHALHPLVAIRIVGLNSSEVADSVRDGRLEAGLVALPVDDRGLDVGHVAWTVEAVYLTTDAGRAATPPRASELAAARLILPEARWGNSDPTRNQLLERLQGAGLALTAAIEVESPALALALAARGLGDTIASRALARSVGLADRLHAVSLDPPLYETFSFITRRGAHLSPATRALVDLAGEQLRRVPRG